MRTKQKKNNQVVVFISLIFVLKQYNQYYPKLNNLLMDQECALYVRIKIQHI